MEGEVYAFMEGPDVTNTLRDNVLGLNRNKSNDCSCFDSKQVFDALTGGKSATDICLSTDNASVRDAHKTVLSQLHWSYL